MSGAFPTTPCPSLPAEIISNSPTLISRAHSGKVQARSVGSQWWSLKLNWKSLTREEFGILSAFADEQRGQAEVFTIALPGELANTQAGVNGSPKVSVAASEGATSVTTSTWTASKTVLKAGDFLKFGNHSKLYRVTATAVSNSSGIVTLGIFPALVMAAPINTTIAVNALQMTARFDADTNAYQIPNRGFYDFSATFVEAL